MKHSYEEALPAGYREIGCVDASAKRFTIFANVIAAAILAAGIIGTEVRMDISLSDAPVFGLLGAAAVIFVYIVLHELVHGAAYKLLTGRKLTFGFTASVAYCGVPDIYVYRRTALISLLAPFTVFTAVFLLAACLLPAGWPRFLALCDFWMHFSGCIGDLYDTALFLFKYRDGDTLMRDTGPVQTFYQKER